MSDIVAKVVAECAKAKKWLIGGAALVLAGVVHKLRFDIAAIAVWLAPGLAMGRCVACPVAALEWSSVSVKWRQFLWCLIPTRRFTPPPPPPSRSGREGISAPHAPSEN